MAKAGKIGKKTAKKAEKNITVKLDKSMPFDEFMQRIVRVKPLKNKPQG
jgi:hypothetical protein